MIRAVIVITVPHSTRIQRLVLVLSVFLGIVAMIISSFNPIQRYTGVAVRVSATALFSVLRMVAYFPCC